MWYILNTQPNSTENMHLKIPLAKHLYMPINSQESKSKAMMLYLFILRFASPGTAASSTASAATTTATPAASAETSAKTSSTTGVVRHLLKTIKTSPFIIQVTLNVSHMSSINAHALQSTCLQIYEPL